MSAMTGTALGAAENARRYNAELAKNPLMQARLGFTHVWYAFRVGHGWSFAPSKFIAYGLSIPDYLATSGVRNGGNTEAHLRKWFDAVAEGSKLHARLATALNEFVAGFGKTPRAAIRIKVLRNDLNDLSDLEDKDAPQRAIVDLMIAVARTLPKKQLKRLRKAIS